MIRNLKKKRIMINEINNIRLIKKIKEKKVIGVRQG